MSISSKKPLYYQLKQTLLKWIEGGDYPPGSILPSEKQLQDSFGISRTTVQNPRFAPLIKVSYTFTPAKIPYIRMDKIIKGTIKSDMYKKRRIKTAPGEPLY